MEHLALYSRLKPSNSHWKILVIGVFCLLGWVGSFLPGVKAQNQNGNQKGLRFRVQQLPSQPVSKPESSPKLPAIWLPEPEINRLLARLPALAAQPQPFSQFRFPNRVVPLPTGMTLRPAVVEPKPSTAKPAPPDASPLTVLRFAPQGEIDLATTLTVMFSQPMVPLTSLYQLSQLPVPVQLSPQPPGRWRWVSTQTVVFEPEGDRFPMATRYQVHIPGETRSQAGNQLAQSLDWEFTTPSLKVTLAQVNIPDLPYEVQEKYNPNRASLKPEIFLEFNQKVTPTALTKHVYLKAQFDRFEVEPVDPSEVKFNDALKQKLQTAKAGQWVVVRPITPLPNNSLVTGVITESLPSAEGPSSLAQPFAFTFQTAYSLHVAWGNDGKIEWYPSQGAIVGFSNYLNLESVRSDLIAVDPPVGETQVSSHLNMVRIEGRFLPEMAYTITVKPGVRDIYGQRLTESETIQVCFPHEPSKLRLPSEYVLTLDPAGPLHLPVYTTNVEQCKVQVYSVKPEDWPAYTGLWKFLEKHPDDPLPTPPGKKVVETTLRPELRPDQMVETPLDLSSALPHQIGHALVVMYGPSDLHQTEDFQPYSSNVYLLWVQSTRLAAEILIQKPRSVAWVTSLESGQPIAGAQVTLYPGGIKALTTSTGLTRLPLIQPVEDQPNWTLVQKGPDSVLLPEGNEYWHLETGAEPKLRWYIFDDRQYYQPGETVSLKGWVRHHSHRYGSDRLDIPAIGQNLKFTVYDNFGVKIAAGLTPINRFGGFDVQVQLPDTVHLGRCGVVFEPLTTLKGIDPDSTEGHHAFQIQEFRRSEFEVTVSVPPGPVLFGQSPEVGVSAQYFTGQAVREAEVKTWVKSEPSHFTPPNWPEFHFGAWTIPKSKTGGPTYFQIKYLFNQLDTSGQYHLKLNLDSIDPLIPGVITTDAQVTDTNRITLKGSASFLVHPAALTVGLRKKRDIPQASSEATVELIVTDLDGNPQPNQEIQLTAFYCDQKWTDEQGWEVVETPVATDNIRSGAQPVVWSFPAHLSGNYRITATVADDQQRQSLSDLLTWYSGETNAAPGGFQAEKASLTLNKSSYLPGETAEILVESSFVPAEGLLTVLKKGILSTQRFTMTSPTQVLKVPVTDELVPAFAVNVDLAGAAPRQTKAGKNAATLPSQPAFATQTIEVPVSLAHRRLSIRVTPQEPVVSPGKPTLVEIELRDHAGHPVVSSDCALAVADEALWSLADAPLPDPIQIFYPKRNEQLRFNNSRETVRLSPLNNGTEASFGAASREESNFHWKAGHPYWSPLLMRETKPYEPRSKPIPKELATTSRPLDDSTSSPDETSVENAPSIRLRTDFSPLAVFVPSVKTDTHGKAKVTFTMPDNVTRYRIIAIAAAGAKQFGTGESTITARLPLMVRPSAPRFLNQGDQFELPVVIQNPSASEVPVEVVVRSNDLVFPNGTGQRVTIPANDRVELRFPAETHRTGTARVQIAAISDQATDGTEIDIPVYSPVSTESLSTYGELTTGSVRHQIDIPADALAAGGTLELTTASTRLPQLTDALRYLLDYQFTCAEQVSSRLIALAALKPRWQEFEKADETLAGKLRQQAEADVKTLLSYQDHLGWFSLWGRETLEPPLPFVSVHATHALIRAKQSGIAVDESALKKALAYLQKIETAFPESYRPEARCTISAYALYVLHLAGNTSGSQVQRILHQYSLEKMPLDAVGWLLPLMAGNEALDNEKNQLLRRINHQAVETSGKVELADSYEDQGFTVFYSKNRTPGIVLEGLLAADPTNPLISKLVLSLIERRSNGRWQNTLENALNLMALQQYFSTRETTIPDFLARVWLGDAFAGEHHFAGRTTEQYQLSIPLNQVGNPGETKPVIVSKDGRGQLYYRLGLNYVPKEVMLSPVEAGFTVARQYEAVDDPDDVKRLSANEWQIRAGARVKVTVTLAVSSRRHHVALVCPIAAGLEILNPALRTAPEDPDQRDRTGDWPKSWLNHQNLRSTRAEAFGSHLTEGLHTYSFFAFATTPGKFLVPPAKAEEMYAPETFGRGQTEIIRVTGE